MEAPATGTGKTLMGPEVLAHLGGGVLSTGRM